MDPFTLGLISSGVGLGGGLLNLFTGGGGNPMGSYRRMLDELQRRFGPQALQQGTQSFYQQLLGSPVFQQQRQDIAVGGAQLQGGISRQLAAAGVNNTGIGAALQAGAAAAPQFQLAQARSGLFNQALEAVSRNFGQLTQAASYGAQGIDFQRDPYAELFAGLTGTGSLLLQQPRAPGQGRSRGGSNTAPGVRLPDYLRG